MAGHRVSKKCASKTRVWNEPIGMPIGPSSWHGEFPHNPTSLWYGLGRREPFVRAWQPFRWPE
jgi:hypothetical protein